MISLRKFSTLSIRVHSCNFAVSQRVNVSVRQVISPIESVVQRAITEKHFKFSPKSEEAIKFCTSYLNAVDTFARFNAESVQSLFALVEKYNIQHDDAFLLLLLKKATRSKNLNIAKLVWQFIRDSRRSCGSRVYGATINMFAKCGSLQNAVEVWDYCAKAGIQLENGAWSAMINAHGIAGNGSDALALFHEMKSQNVEINERTLGSALNACSRSGRAGDAWKIYNEMEVVYNVKPNIVHLNSILGMSLVNIIFLLLTS
jgi:pentatricopeptide repeat protein